MKSPRNCSATDLRFKDKNLRFEDIKHIENINLIEGINLIENIIP